MDIASSCPACGAQLTIPSDARQVTCSFCGNRFSTDMSGVEPVLKVTSPSTEMPDVPAVPAPFPDLKIPEDEIPEPPKMPEFVPAQPNTPKPAGVFNSERIPPAIRRQPIWAIIAGIVAVLLCMVFGCMAVAYFAIQSLIR